MGRVGIVTLHYPYNYGSVFQAFCLQSYIENKGYEAEIINYLMPFDYENYRLFRVKQYYRRPISLLVDVFFLLHNMKRKNAFKRFTQKYLNVTPVKYTSIEQMKNIDDRFDMFVCGSDQIWNFDCTNGVDPVYFLHFTSKKKIAYAPSLAQKEFKNIDENKIKRYLAEFDYLSVREETSIEFLRRYTDKNISVTLDPTLLVDSSMLEKMAASSRTVITKKEYIFVYILEENYELVKFAIEYARRNDFEIVYISNVSKKNAQMLSGHINGFGISPETFLKTIKDAQAVITNSFHTTIFSIQFKKKLVVFKTRKSFLRLDGLLKSLNLEYCIYNNEWKDSDLDYSNIDTKLDKLRVISRGYLDSALDNK